MKLKIKYFNDKQLFFQKGYLLIKNKNYLPKKNQDKN